MPFIILLFLAASTTVVAGEEDFEPSPSLPMHIASVESLVTIAEWSYAIDEQGDIRLLFGGAADQPDHVVYLVIEKTPDNRAWGVTFLHPVGVISAPQANENLEQLLRAANDFNRTRAFGKILLDPTEDGSWSIQLIHTFAFADGISPANFLDPVVLLLREMDGLHDRFFVPLPELP